MGGNKLSSYRELRVWQQAMELTQTVYRMTELLPADEKFGLCSQMKRAAVSVPANIAEGYGRRNRGEYVHFLSISNGSLRELETLVILGTNLGYFPDGGQLLADCEVVGRMLHALSAKLSPNGA